MTTSQTPNPDPAETRPPFDPERLERLHELAQQQAATRRGQHQQADARLKAIEKVAIALGAESKNGQPDDPVLIDLENQLATLKRQHQRAQESQKPLAADTEATADLLERCRKYAERRGYRLGVGWIARRSAHPDDQRYSMPPLPGHEDAAALRAAARDQRRGVIQ